MLTPSSADSTSSWSRSSSVTRAQRSMVRETPSPWLRWNAGRRRGAFRTFHARWIWSRNQVRKLKEIHAATHPSAKLEPPAHEAPVDGEDVPAEELRAELFSSLAAEADDEDDGREEGEQDDGDG